MPALALVVSNDTFLTWRTRTNELISVLNMPLNETNGVVTQLSTRAETFDITASAGVHIGCTVTDNGDGTVAITAGECLLRLGALSSDPLQACSLAAVVSLAMANVATNFIYADYSGGVPTIAVTQTKANITGTTMAPIATVVRDALDLTILQQAGEAGDFERRLSNRLMDTSGLTHSFGADMSSPSGLSLSVTSGEFYYGQSGYLTTGFDSSIAGTAPANIFERYFTTGPGAWVTEPGVKVFNPTQYNGPAGLVAMTVAAGLYTTAWIYMKVGTNKQALYVLYGNGEYASITAARAETPPQSVPYELQTLGVLLGRAILQEGSLIPISLDSVLNKTNFASSATTQFDDGLFAIYNAVDSTKRIHIDAGDISTGKTRVLKAPDKSGTLATISDAKRHSDEVGYHASMGMLGKRVAPYNMNVTYGSSEDNTTIFVNGVAVEKIHKDMVGSVFLNSGDIIESNKPLVVKDAADGHQLAAIDSASEHFVLWTNRVSPHSLYFYSAHTDANVRIYKNTTNYTTATLKAGTSLAATDPSGTYIEVPTPSGGVSSAIVADNDFGNQYIVISDAPITFMKDGTGGDAMSVFPMSREYICSYPSVPDHTVSIDGISAVNTVSGQLTTMTAAEALAGTVVAPVADTRPGYYTCDVLASSFANADGAGMNGVVGIPVNMLGDTYMIDHDLAGYEVVAIEPTIIRVYGSDNLFTTHDLSTASRSNPMKVVVGNTALGVPGAVALQPTNYFLKYSNRSSATLFTIGETITGGTSGATAIVAEDKGDVLILTGVSLAVGFVNGEVITGGTSTFTAGTASAQYATWHFKGTSPFAVRVNDPADDEYLAIGFEKSKRLPSGVTDQLSDKIHLVETELLARSDFVEAWDSIGKNEWSNTNPNSVYKSTAGVGGSTSKEYLEVSGFTQISYKEPIPFDDTKIYKISVKLRQSILSTVANKQAVFLSVNTMTESELIIPSLSVNGVQAIFNGDISLVGSPGVSVDLGAETTDTNGWVTIVGYIKGFRAPGWTRGVGATLFDGSSISNPLPVSILTKYISPVIEVNADNTGASAATGDGTVDIDMLKIEEVSWATHEARIDNPHNVTPSQIGAEAADVTIQAHVQSNHPDVIATLLEAQSGASNTVAMTPLRTADEIKALARPHKVNDVTWMSKSTGNVFSILMNGKLYTAFATAGTWLHYSGRSSAADGRVSEWGIKRGLTEVIFPEATAKIIKAGSSQGSTSNCFALFDNGNLYMWGNNRNGQCGFGNTTATNQPTLSATAVSDVYECTHAGVYGYHARYFIKKTDGTIWGAGANYFGAVGVGNTTGTISTWTHIIALGTNTTKMFLIGGYVGQSFALKADGTIWACGYNAYGSIGDSTTVNRTTFKDVTLAWGGPCSDIIQMGGGVSYYVPPGAVNNYTNIIMLRTDVNGVNGCYTCGNSTWGTRGNGTIGLVNGAPYYIPNSSTYVEISVFGGGPASIYARTNINELFVWGYNAFGQLGTNNTTKHTTPTLVKTDCAKLFGDGVDAHTHGHYATGFYKSTNGKLFATGYNPYGQLGNGLTAQSNVFVETLIPHDEGGIVELGFMTSTGTTMNFVARMASGKLYCWGYGGQHNIVQGQTSVAAWPVGVVLPE